MRKLQFGVAVIVLALATAVQAADLQKKTKLFEGVQANCNAGVATTSQNHLNCTTRPLGYTVDDASAVPAGDFVEVLVGTAPNVNAGEVTTSPNHKGGATRPIGYLSKKAIQGGAKLYIGTQGGCNAGVVTPINQHLNCSTDYLGYALPE